MNPLWMTYRIVAPLLGGCAPAGLWITSPPDQRAWRERMGETARPGGVDAWVPGPTMARITGVRQRRSVALTRGP